MKTRLFFLLAGFALGATAADYDYPFRNPDLPVEERITDLIGRMTLD
jgi:beta-glucosidase